MIRLRAATRSKTRRPLASPAPLPGRGMRRPFRHRRRRRFTVPRIVLAALVLLTALVGADLIAYRARIHPGVEVGGMSLGGLDTAAAIEMLDAQADELLDRPIRFRWKERTFDATLAELGWQPDPAATAREAERVGRAGPLWESVGARALAWVRPAAVTWQGTWDRPSLRNIVARWTKKVDLPPAEGRVRVEDGVVETRMPVAGRRVDAGAVLALASEAILGRREAPLPLVRADPRTTRADVEAAAEEVRALIEAPIDVRLGPARTEISPEQLGTAIRTAVRPREPEGGRLEVLLAPARVEPLLEPYRADAERAPRPATFVIRGASVRIEPSVPGRELNPSLAAEHLLRIAQSPERAGRIPLARVQASFTSKDAKGLGIVEEVSSFTTNHAAGEPRVQNIHRAADILDGAVVEPGETFSLNGHLGNRTADRGFVEAPVIYNGEFTSDIGGGVSQLATTTFNAVFFGGYPILEHQAHSFYISRYPMGREATVSWPKPDLIFRNDTPTGLLIKTEYTGSSITVRIYGDRHGRKVTATDPVVTGRSANGFSVMVERIVAEGGKEVDRETFLTFYRSG